jgi:hypothetical protein
MKPDPLNQSLTENESIFTDADLVPKLKNPHVRNARIVVFILAGLMLLSNLGTLMNHTPPGEKIAELIVGLVFTGIFTGLGLWSRRKPFIALLIATILYGVIFGFAIVGQPEIFRAAWYIILPLLALLILGVVYGKKMQDNMKLLKDR